jgi:REP element-mobilizing transposase RayT
MPQSLSAVYVHVVFSTLHREPFLTDDDLRSRLHAYLAEISRRLDCPASEVGGTADHVHVLSLLGRSITLADWVKELKRVSSQWLKDQSPALSGFAWQAGYGAFSVSASQLDTVTAYIRTQEEHHRLTSFQDEYRAFLKKYRLVCDERYVWD